MDLWVKVIMLFFSPGALVCVMLRMFWFRKTNLGLNSEWKKFQYTSVATTAAGWSHQIRTLCTRVRCNKWTCSYMPRHQMLPALRLYYIYYINIYMEIMEYKMDWERYWQCSSLVVWIICNLCHKSNGCFLLCVYEDVLNILFIFPPFPIK